jgi:hypothetical protein
VCDILTGGARPGMIGDGDGDDRRWNAAHVEGDRAVVPL